MFSFNVLLTKTACFFFLVQNTGFPSSWIMPCWNMQKPAAHDFSRSVCMSGLQQLQLSGDGNFCSCHQICHCSGLAFLEQRQVCFCLTVLQDGSVAVTHMDKTLPHCSARAKWLDNEKERMNWGYTFLPLHWTWLQCIDSWRRTPSCHLETEFVLGVYWHLTCAWSQKYYDIAHFLSSEK